MKYLQLTFFALLGLLLVAANTSVIFAQSASLFSTGKGLPFLPPKVHDPKECAAFAVVRLGQNLFLVGSDEDNNLRLYSTTDFNKIESLYPLASIFQKVKAPSILESPKTDIEGAAWMGSLVYLIGSHSMNTEGTKDKPERRRTFAVEIKYNEDGITLSSAGTPYSKLIEDLSSDGCSFFDFLKTNRR